MFSNLFLNITIITTFIFFIGQLYKNHQTDNNSPLGLKVVSGLALGILGISLMSYRIHLTNTVIIDLRHLATTSAAVFGGSLSAIITSVIIGVYRLYLFGVTYTSILGLITALAVGLICALIYKTNLSQAAKYIYANSSAMVLAVLATAYAAPDPQTLKTLFTYYLPFAILGNVLNYLLLKYIISSNDSLQKLNYHKLMADNLTSMLSAHRTDGIFLYASPSSKQITGWEANELLEKNFYDLFHTADVEKIKDCFTQILLGSELCSQTCKIKQKDGSQIWVELVLKGIKNKEGKITQLICLSSDITETKDKERQLANSEQMLRTLLNSMEDIVYTLDLDQRYNGIYGNWLNKFGLSKELFLGKTIVEIMGKENAQIHQKANEQALRGENVVYTWNFQTGRGNRFIQTSLSPLFNKQNQITGIVGVGRDITQQKSVEKKLLDLNGKLEQQAFLDGLTQINNRLYLDKRLSVEWARGARSKKPISLIMLDIDYFKAYNDIYGHLQGDECLESIAKIIKKTVKRPTDITARYGGEEFIVVLPDTDREGAVHVAQEIKQAIEGLKLPHSGSQVAPYVTVSMGVAVALPETGQSSKQLIAQADQALYLAKEGGRNKIEVFKN
jgi:diguanylate cyclase (GGDEF)-like protein/PAS domain S-box-containing protein